MTMPHIRTLTLMKSFLLAVFLCAAVSPSFAVEPLHYQLSFERPNTHLMDIAIRADGLDGKSVQFALPCWAPGVYIVEEFAVNVQGFHAEDGSGQPLEWRKVHDGQTWQVELNGAASAIVHYQIYADGLPFRGAQYNDHHASLTGAAVWMYVVNGKDRPADLTIDRHALPAAWKVATGMARAGDNTWAAQNYDWFADCPIEISDYVERDFTALGTTYHIVVDDEIGKQDFTQFAADMQKIIEKGVVPILAPAVGGPLAAPFADYYFLIHLTNAFPGTGASVEHLTSTMIIMGKEWDDHGATTHDFLTDLYSVKLDLATHEFFHAWNVKRLRPRELGPFDYSQMVHTNSLWISEGLTNYYTAIAQQRAGYWSPQQCLDYNARVITGLEAEPGRKERSLEQTSWDTWFGFAGSGAGGLASNSANNLENTTYSYYDAGQIVGVLLDLEIRHATSNQKSLDDWMRLMYQRYALPKPGFEPADAVRAASEIAGRDMSDFFRRYVSGKEPLPYERDFGYAGIQVDKAYPAKPWLGITLEGGAHPRIDNLIPSGPAELAGLDRGDELVALDGTEINRDSLDGALAKRKAGDRVLFSVIHRGQLHEIPVTLAADPNPTYTLKPVEHRSDAQLKIYKGMFGLQ